ncbi:MAG: response regulator transcription factor [Cellulosilyticaceae bacterium]
MKLNVVIADDEYFIRQRLLKLIPWEILELNLIGEAENGLQVLDFLKTHPIDLVILDIQMPKMTGIEVAQYIYDHYPTTKVLILSGYNDFEYARQTLRYDVVDYLLKPIEPKLLYNVLTSCCDKIHRSQQSLLTLKRYEHFEKQTKLTEVLHSLLPLSSLYTCYPELKNTTASTFISCYMSDNNTDNLDALKDTFLSYGFICEYFKESEYIYIFQVFLEHASDYHDLQHLLESFIGNHTNYTCYLLGELFFIERPWLPYYKATLEGLGKRYFHPTSCILHFQQDMLQTSPQSLHKSVSKVRQKLTTLINSRDTTGLQDFFDKCFAQIVEQSSVYYLHTVLHEILLTYKIFYSELIDLENNIHQHTLDLLDEYYSLEDLKNLLISYGLQCLSSKDALPSDIVLSQKIMSYIHEHYQDVDLSVAKLADVFGLNTSYLGTLFKKASNQSLLQYITTYRLEASKKLLETQKYKVSEIAELVGYSDVFYYSKRFKKAYGYSPKEYSTVSCL